MSALFETPEPVRIPEPATPPVPALAVAPVVVAGPPELVVAEPPEPVAVKPDARPMAPHSVAPRPSRFVAFVLRLLGRL